jgi:hypothetical protein
MSFSLISTTTVGAGGTTAVTFSSIAGTFTDLVVMVSAKYNNAGWDQNYLSMQFNGDTGSNYTWGNLQFDGFSFPAKEYTTATTRMNLGQIPGGNSGATFMGSVKIQIPYYASSETKVCDSEWSWTRDANSNYNLGVSGGGWTNTGAITSIRLFSPNTLTFAQNSVFSLYGRTKGSGGATVS